MSAAEPAGPLDAGPTAAAVIPLNRKRRHRRDAAVTVLEPSPEQLMAEAVEAQFQRAEHRTLTDEETAAVYRIALAVVCDLVDGVLAQQHLGEEEHRLLQAHLAALKRAPDLLS